MTQQPEVRLHVVEGQPATIEPSHADPGEVRAAVMRARGRRDVTYVGDQPSEAEVLSWFHRISSASGPLPLWVRRAVRRLRIQARNRH